MSSPLPCLAGKYRSLEHVLKGHSVGSHGHILSAPQTPKLGSFQCSGQVRKDSTTVLVLVAEGVLAKEIVEITKCSGGGKNDSSDFTFNT